MIRATTCALCVLFLASCGTKKVEERVEEVVPPASAEALPDLISRSRPLMGTVFQIKVAADAERAGPALRSAFDEIERLEHVLSEWRTDSEISEINAKAGISAVSVSEDTYTVIKAGMDVSKWSEGAFDLSWAALRGLYDFRPGQQRIPDPKDVKKRLSLIRYQDIELDESAHSVFLKRKGMAIGTGGIAKGYALDRAGDILKKAGIKSYMLFGGGQVQVHGLRGTRAWRVGIQHPRRADVYFSFFESSGGSISTSGDYEHYMIDAKGKRWHHILNPRSGLPVTKSTSVTIHAPSGLYADAMSTAVFVMGPEQAMKRLAESPVKAEVAVLDGKCRLFSSGETLKKLQFKIPLEDGVLPGC